MLAFALRTIMEESGISVQTFNGEKQGCAKDVRQGRIVSGPIAGGGAIQRIRDAPVWTSLMVMAAAPRPGSSLGFQDFMKSKKVPEVW